MESQKKHIDNIRDAAKSIDVGTDDDRSAIVYMMTIGNELHIIKERGIYRFQDADDIDPERTNVSIPDIHQRVLKYGTDSILVARTLLTARVLLSKDMLKPSIDVEKGLLLTLAALKDFMAMYELKEQLVADQNLAIENFNQQEKSQRALSMPSLGDCESRCKSFIQKAEHTLQTLLGIIRLFYGEQATKVWFQTLTEYCESEYGDSDRFSIFMRESLPFLRFIRNCRHCIEHKREGQQILIQDFVLNHQGQIVLPSIEIEHIETTQSELPIAAFMAGLIEDLSILFETMLALLCSKNARTDGPLPYEVALLPISTQKAWYGVRYGYVANINGQICPFIPRST